MESIAFQILVYTFATIAVLVLVAEPRTATAQPATEPEAEPEPTETEKGQAVPFADTIVPFRRPQQPAWAGLTPAELRKACQQAGIKWRNAHGKNRHLTKNQMIAALQRMRSAA